MKVAVIVSIFMLFFVFIISCDNGGTKSLNDDDSGENDDVMNDTAADDSDVPFDIDNAIDDPGFSDGDSLMPDEKEDADIACHDSEIAKVDCTTADCTVMSVAGDPQAQTAPPFRGLGDPDLSDDPDVSGRLWMLYTWLTLSEGKNLLGADVLIPTASIHLGRSDDGGATFSFVKDLWSSVENTDPEGSGEVGRFNQESSSLTWMRDGEGNVRWFGIRHFYFMRPKTAYAPKFGTGWTLALSVADSPEELSDGPDLLFGVVGTADAYNVDVKIDELAGLPQAHCAMLNNPDLFTQGDTLYLSVECLAFVGTTLDADNTTTQLLATVPEGDPADWVWRHVGVLVDKSLAVELDSEITQQPDLSVAADGALLLLTTPADNTDGIGTLHKGCVAVELESIDPVVYAKDCKGNTAIRAVVEGDHMGSCTRSTESASGILSHVTGVSGEINQWSIHITGLQF